MTKRFINFLMGIIQVSQEELDIKIDVKKNLMFEVSSCS